MKKMYTTLLFYFLSLLLFSSNIYAIAPRFDILFVLDNSGSMKKHDPDFMTGKSVANLIKGLSNDSRVGIIVFDDKADFAMPLTSIANPDLEKNVEKSLQRLSYNGKYTNTPIAIEKAIYELKQNGRKDVEKLIIFMTDGFIDTGDVKKDGELRKWLKEELIVDAKKSGIRIFSLAFTEEADFELIQTLAVNTGGGYYRAGKIEDLEKVFGNIQQAIIIPIVKTTPITVKEGISNELLLVAIVGLVILAIVVIGVRSKRKVENPGVVESQQMALPHAILEDIESITGKKEIRLSKKDISIGRAVGDGKPSVDIAIPQHTVSALHATIEYRDNSFFLTDRRSTNKTFLNNQSLTPDVSQRLKSGDMITFDKYKFRFLVKEQIAKSGTILRPAVAGGTIMRPQGFSPERIPQPPVPDPEQPRYNHDNDDEDGTRVKPGVCEIHPSYKATEFCPVCKKGFCSECMVEKDGQKICHTCAAKIG
jgi:Mg-chelatase subunit ChlD